MATPYHRAGKRLTAGRANDTGKRPRHGYAALPLRTCVRHRWARPLLTIAVVRMEDWQMIRMPLAVLLAASLPVPTSAQIVSEEQASEIARDAYVYAYPLM